MNLRNTVVTWRVAITKSDLPPVARHVALTLSLYMSEAGDSAFPGAALLAEDTGLSDRCVRQHLALMVERGWLLLVERGGLRGQRRRANAYRAALPDPGRTVTDDGASPVTDTALTPAPAGRDPGTTCRPTDQELPTTKELPRKRGSRIPIPFTVTDKMIEWATAECPGLDWDFETRQFVDYWRAVTGAKATKLDWTATWRTWMRRTHTREQR